MTNEGRTELAQGAIPIQSALDDFELEHMLGEGGMAKVWRATHRATGALVALKLLRSENITDPTWAQRFHREARAMADLRHPHIARVLAFGGGTGGLFIAFELIEGGTLRELKAAMGGTVPVPIAVEITAQLLAALEYAHAAGVIHRDIKPGNVMLTRDGVVKLVDFGIAKGEDDIHLTRTGAVIGTPAFMAPEQALGDRSDERSDLFSVGLLLSDLVTGKSPFSAESTSATLLRVVREEVPLLCESAGGVPWNLERIHSRLVEHDRERRPIGADLALQDFGPIVRVIRSQWPSLLGDAVTAAAKTAQLVRRATATMELLRAEQILEQCGAHESAVLALTEAVRIDPTFEDAARRLPLIASQAGIVLRPGPDDEALHEVLAGLRLQPRQMELWRRLAELRAERREVFAEAVAWKRLLRLREDQHAAFRLRELLEGPSALSTSAFADQGVREDRADRGTRGVRTDRNAQDDGKAREDQTTASVRRHRRRVAPRFVGATVGIGALLIAVVLGGLWLARTPPVHPSGAQVGAQVGAQAGIPHAADADSIVARAKPSPGTRAGAEENLAGTAERNDAEPGPRAESTSTTREILHVPVRGPAIVQLWGGPCPPELSAWRRALRRLPAGASIVHVTHRRGEPSRADLLAPEDDVRSTVQVDADGSGFFLPARVSGCATLVVDDEGRVRLRTTSTSLQFASLVAKTWEVLAAEPAMIDEAVPSVGERIQRLRTCAPDSRCALRAVESWARGVPPDEDTVDACLLSCDPGAAPVQVVLSGARRALAEGDPERALRLLEPWRATNVADIHRALGDAHLKQHHLQEARAHYARYLELMPGASDAPAIREQLQN